MSFQDDAREALLDAINDTESPVVWMTRQNGSLVGLLASPIRDTPKADFQPQGYENGGAPVRYGFMHVDRLRPAEILTLVDTGTGVTYRYDVEMVTPNIAGPGAAFYTSVLLQHPGPKVET